MVPVQICTMYYHFNEDINERCLLLLGDVGGHVRVLSFSAVGRGPFQNRAERPLVQLRHVDLQRRVRAVFRIIYGLMTE